MGRAQTGHANDSCPSLAELTVLFVCPICVPQQVFYARFALHEEDRPRRHGRLLRFGRAARPAGAQGEAGRGRLDGAAVGGLRGVVRGAALRDPLGDGGGHRAAPVSAGDLRAARLHALQGGVAAGAGDLPPPHRARRAAVARRGLPRRHRGAHRPPDRDRDGARHPARDPRRDRPHRLGRRRAEQVPRQDRLRLEEARRPVRHPAAGGRGVSRSACRSASSPGSARPPAPPSPRMGVATVGDLRARSLVELEMRFGKFGRRLHELSRGIDDHPVVSERPVKSISSETTFENDLPIAALPATIERLARPGLRGRPPARSRPGAR